MDSKIKTASLASAVAMLFVACGGSNSSSSGAATPSPTAGGDQVKCVGLNACKAQGVCAQADHACKGQNGCKGQGVTLVTPTECASKGGKAI